MGERGGEQGDKREGADDGCAWMESDGAAGNSSCTNSDTHTHLRLLENDNRLDTLNEQQMTRTEPL